EAVEERPVAADDVDLRVLERGRQHAGLGLGDRLLGGDLGHLHLAVALELEAELLVRARLAGEVLHRLALLGQARGLGEQLLADRRRLGHALALLRDRLGRALLLDRRRVLTRTSARPFCSSPAAATAKRSR